MLRSVIFAVAIISGLLAAYMAAKPSSVSMDAQASTPPAIATMEILVAQSNITMGSELGSDHLDWAEWPIASVTEDHLVKGKNDEAVEQLMGSKAKASFLKGEPLQVSKLNGSGAAYLSTSLMSGKRAVAVKISAHNTAGGFILPEDRVDVLHTETLPSSSGVETSTRTLLTNVRVLAVDQRSQDKQPQNTTAVGKTATLEVDPRQAEIIASAESSGSISLALRALSDSDDLSTSSVPSSIKFIRSGKVETVRIGTGS